MIPPSVGLPRRIYLALGSNEGDRRAHLAAAIDLLRERGIRPLASSPVYRTQPVGGPTQPDYLNAVLEAETGLEPEEVLQRALEAETARGRRRGDGEPHWGPRPLDVDLLLYADQLIASVTLQIPHPRMHLRRFVLAPLNDLCPERVPPGQEKTVHTLLQGCQDDAAVAPHGPPLQV
jgi:2-amino-4-hydroxy-6-hydroxymethyldihydropteridine diphosphokinase